MKQSILVVALLALLVSSTAWAYHGKTIHLTGQNDASLDRAAIQAAVDSANRGDKIVLEGVFQLDGTPIFV